MTRLILHIGDAKTGTTTLQKCLFDSHETLLKHGFLYPKPLNGIMHADIIPHLLGVDDSPLWIKRRSNYDPIKILEEGRKAWENVVAQTSQNPECTVILSSEHLFDFAKSSHFLDALGKIRILADEIVIVAYVRSPSGRYLSSKQENLKSGKINSPPNGYPIYRTALEPLLKQHNLRIELQKFDRDSLIGNDIIIDFASRYLTPQAMESLERPDSDLNTSFSPEAMAILETICNDNTPKRFALIGAVNHRLKEHINAVDRAIPGKKSPHYKPGIARIVHDQATDLKWLEDNFAIKFDPPEIDVETTRVGPKALVSVRDLCVVDEARMSLLWTALADGTPTKSMNKNASDLPKKSAASKNPIPLGSSGVRDFLLPLGFRPISIIKRLRRGFRRIGRLLKRLLLSFH